MRNELASYLQARGLPWIVSSAPGAICSGLEALSNSSFTFSAEFDSTPCGPAPPAGSVTASLTVTFEGKEVVLEAWSDAEG
jgi:hypothetical protein